MQSLVIVTTYFNPRVKIELVEMSVTWTKSNHKEHKGSGQNMSEAIPVIGSSVLFLGLPPPLKRILII